MRQSIITIILSLIFLPLVFAQGNMPEFDDRPFRLGFYLGSNVMDLDVTPSEMVQDGKIYYADVSKLVPGFSVGLVTDLRLHRYFNLRFTPALLLGERDLSFRVYDTATQTMSDDITVNIFSLPFDLPLMVRYSAERFGNFRPYIQAGGGTYFDLGRDELKDVTLNLVDFYFTAGFGMDIYFRLFKLSPEVRLNLGFTNILTPKNPTGDTVMNLVYTNAISKLLSRIVVFSLNIE